MAYKEMPPENQVKRAKKKVLAAFEGLKKGF